MWWLLSFALSAVFLSHVVAKVLFVTQCVCVLRAISDFLTFFLSFLLFLSFSTSRLNYVRFRTLSLLSSFYFPYPILLHLLLFLLLLCSTHIYCVEDKGDAGREWSRKASVNCVCVYVAPPLGFWVGRQLLCYVTKVDTDTHTHKRAKKRPVPSLGFHLCLSSNFLFFLICLFSIPL